MFFIFAVLSGLSGAFVSAFWAGPMLSVRIAQTLIGPVCAAMGSLWVRHWLSVHQRDRFGNNLLRVVTIMCLLGAPLCLLLKPDWALPLSAALTMINVSVALLISVRAAQSGDKLAWGLALGCALPLPAQIGLYTMALGSSKLSC